MVVGRFRNWRSDNNKLSLQPMLNTPRVKIYVAVNPQSQSSTPHGIPTPENHLKTANDLSESHLFMLADRAQDSFSEMPSAGLTA